MLISDAAIVRMTSNCSRSACVIANPIPETAGLLNNAAARGTFQSDVIATGATWPRRKQARPASAGFSKMREK
jgi:hypothetical protein